MFNNPELYQKLAPKISIKREPFNCYLRCKPRLKLIRCEDEPMWMASDYGVACVMKTGYGKTPSEAYWDWFADEIPF